MELSCSLRFVTKKVCLEILNLVVELIGIAATIATVIVALYVCYRSERPEVVAYLDYDIDHSSVNFVVANVGKGVARDIVLAGFDFDLVEPAMREIVHHGFISNGIPLLVPGASRQTVVGAGKSLKELQDARCVVTVSYQWNRRIGKGKKAEDFVLDYYSFSGSLYTKSDLHEIKQSLEKSSKNLAALQKNVSQIADAGTNVTRQRDDPMS